MEDLEKAKEFILSSKNIVFFGGAGVSTESGIPDFRSVDGLYHKSYDYPPETILSHSFYKTHTKEFFKFYREKMLYLDAKPNITHEALVKLEERGSLKAIITQNIDGLHQLAGSKNVLELHGSIHRNYCECCKKFYPIQKMIDSKEIPTCACGGTIKPDVILYEEGLDSEIIQMSIDFIKHADVLLVGGTSLSVYPAAGMIEYYNGNKLILINKEATAKDSLATINIRNSLSKVFEKVMENLK